MYILYMYNLFYSCYCHYTKAGCTFIYNMYSIQYIHTLYYIVIIEQLKIIEHQEGEGQNMKYELEVFKSSFDIRCWKMISS